MKKLMLSALFLILLPCFTFGASPPTAASPVFKAKVPLLKEKKVKQNIRTKKILLKSNAKVKIISMRLKTSANGDWLFEFVIKNTGSATLKPPQLQYKPFQILKNGIRVPVHIVSSVPTLVPGGVHSALKINWDRCSKASKLMLEIIYQGQVLDTKTINLPPINIQINNLSLNRDHTKYFLFLKNITGHTAKVTFRLFSSRPLGGGAGGSMNMVGAETTVVIPANTQKNYIGAVGNPGNSLELQVLFKDEKKCSGKGYAILNSRALPSESTITGSGGQSSGIAGKSSSAKPLKNRVIAIKNPGSGFSKTMSAKSLNNTLLKKFIITKTYIVSQWAGRYEFHFETSTGADLSLMQYSDMFVRVSYYESAGAPRKWWTDIGGGWVMKRGNNLVWLANFPKTETIDNPGSYFLFFFKINTDHFLSENGVMLDGDNDGQPGGDYRHNFFFGSDYPL